MADGLSVKERLKLLQSTGGNTNPLLSGAPRAVAVPKPSPVTPAPKPSGPEFPAKPLKSVTTNATLKPVTPMKPGTANSTGANSQQDGMKPSTPAKPDASNTPRGVFPVQLRHVEKTGGVGVTPVGKKPVGGVTPLVPKKPEAGSGGDASSQNPTENGIGNASEITPKRLSIAERMAALAEKAGGDLDSKPKENGLGSPPPVLPKSPGLHKSPCIPTESTVKRLAHLPDTAAKDHFAAPKPTVQNGIDTANSVAHRAKDAEKATDKRRSSELFLRKSDQRKFRKLEPPSEKIPEPAPAKPAKMDSVDLSAFVLEYAKAKEQVLKEDSITSGETDDGEMEELYVEAESVPVAIRGTRGSLHRTTSVRVSKIPEMTEEEEMEVYDDCQSEKLPPPPLPDEPEEFYDDCASGEPIEEDPDEVYEAVTEDVEAMEAEPSPPPVPSPSPSTEDKKKKKEKDKEKEKEKEKAKKKEKDEKNKKEEKERKKREEEERKMRHKFGLKDTDEKVGDGIVLKDETPSSWLIGSKDLSVTQGEIVTILRMDKNPTGKWLVQNANGRIGYVNSNNIEVSTPTIRHVLGEQSPKVMTGLKGDHPLDDAAFDEGPEEEYEALPDEGEMDEIYEECT